MNSETILTGKNLSNTAVSPFPFGTETADGPVRAYGGYNQSHWGHALRLLYLANFLRNIRKNNAAEISYAAAGIAELLEGPELCELLDAIVPEPENKNVQSNFRRSRYRNDENPLAERVGAALCNTGTRRRALDAFGDLAEKMRACHEAIDFANDADYARFCETANFFRLSKTESAVLVCLKLTVFRFGRRHHYEKWREADFFNDSTLSERVDFVAKCLVRDANEVFGALRSESKLLRFGIINDGFQINSRVADFMERANDNPLNEAFYKEFTGEALPWHFYGETGKTHGETVKELIHSRKAGRGLNILLTGEAGTGKTSMARSIARDLGFRCFEVAMPSEAREERESRYADTSARYTLVRACAELNDDEKSMIIVDEADKMLSVFSSVKERFNNMLDELKATIVWIANTPVKMMDKSNLRRFDYNIQFDDTDSTARRAAWRNCVESFGIGDRVSDEMIDDLSEAYPLNTGLVARVLANFADVNPPPEKSREWFESMLKQHCDLMGVKTRESWLADSKPVGEYTLECLNVTNGGPVGVIITKMRKVLGKTTDKNDVSRPPRMNMLLSGPPGSGKSEFVRYLAGELKRRVINKRASDLLGCFVGETEKKIAAAFREAERENAILFLDECDSFLASRANAARSWEVTQVNELLTQMEAFKGIFVAATNFAENLDAASVRRFNMKIGLGYLTDDGKAVLFNKIFTRELDSDERAVLDRIPNLTPGDFRTLAENCRFDEPEEITTAKLLAGLKAESYVKHSIGDKAFAPKKQIGFSATR